MTRENRTANDLTLGVLPWLRSQRAVDQARALVRALSREAGRAHRSGDQVRWLRLVALYPRALRRLRRRQRGALSRRAAQR